MPEKMIANIHEFYPHPTTGHVEYDEDGDPVLGFYFEILDNNGYPISQILGPYIDAEEAEQACHRAWTIGDF